MKFILCLIFPAVLISCSSSSSGHTTSGAGAGRLVLTGSSTVAPLAGDIAKRFEALHPGSRIDVQTGGSSRGIADTRQGLADIGMASRDLRADEADLLAFPIARDGICMIVHRDNPVESLSTDQIRGIYRGEIENWSEVGGADLQITVVHKADGRSTLELFLEYFALKNIEVVPDVVVGDNEQGIKTVTPNPGAIGYVSIGAAEYSATHGVPIKILPLDGVAATVAHVADGTFPLARTLHLLTREAPEGLAKSFIEFAQSEEAHDIVGRHYFVPIVR